MRVHDASQGEQRYEQLVREESARQGVAVQQLAALFQRPTFSAALLEAAHGTVISATSKKRSSHEIQFQRLQRSAMKRRATTSRVRHRASRAKPAEATLQSDTRKQDWDALLRSLEHIAPVPPASDEKTLSEVSEAVDTAASAALAVADSPLCLLPVALLQMYAGVLRYQHQHMRRRLLQYKAVLDRGLQDRTAVETELELPSVPAETETPQPSARCSRAAAACQKASYGHRDAEAAALRPLRRAAEEKERAGHPLVRACHVQAMRDAAAAGGQPALPVLPLLLLRAQRPAAAGTVQRAELTCSTALLSHCTVQSLTILDRIVRTSCRPLLAPS